MTVSLVPGQPITMSIVSTPAHLPVVRAALGELARLIGFDERGADGLVLAVDEALANVIEHAYEGRSDGPITVSFTALLEIDRQVGIEVVLEDRGQSVDKRLIHGRDLDDIRPGGLGTHIMIACMDQLEYAHRDGGGTRLRMLKYLPLPAEAAGATITGESRGST